MESMVNDMKISKRGGAEPSLNFAIGMIIGITIILIFGGIVLKFWMASQQTRESFDLFTEELLELEEMGEGDEVLFVSDKYNIVAFTADDLVSECVPNTLMHPFEEQMKKPVGCGNEPCICYCKIGASGLILDTNCQKSGYCKSLKDLDYNLTFQYSGCNFGDGLFIPGGDGGIIELHYKREGETIYVSEDQDSLYSSDFTETVDSFNTYLSDIDECEKDTRDCKCELDHNFLSYGVSIAFTENNVTLASINRIILERDTELKLELFESQLDENLFYVRFIEAADITSPLYVKETDPDKIFNNEVIIYDNPEEITEGTITEYVVRSKVDIVHSTLYKKDGTFYFYRTDKQEDLPHCNSIEINT
jgi:hypothetical protein